MERNVHKLHGRIYPALIFENTLFEKIMFKKINTPRYSSFVITKLVLGLIRRQANAL